MINTVERFAEVLIEDVSEAVKPLLYTREGKKMIATMQRKLAGYFRKLGRGFPLTDSVRVWKRHPEIHREEEEVKEAVSPVEQELQLIYTEWVGKESARLAAVLEESIGESAAEGWKGSMREWVEKYKLTPPPAGLDPLVPKALLEWTRGNAAELVVGIDKRTVERMAHVIADGMSGQEDIAQLTRSLQKAFGDEITGMAGDRARLIAVTETNAAYSEGGWQAAEDVGSQWKESIDTGLEPGRSPCAEVCEPNAEAGRIKIGEAFPSGDMHTPFHPDCWCDTAYTGATRESVEKALGGGG